MSEQRGTCSRIVEPGYSLRQAAALLEVTPARIRAFLEVGLLKGAEKPGVDARFSFQDLVLLRTAKGLFDQNISRKRIQRALANLKAQLPSGKPLTGVVIAAEGETLVVREGAKRWNPESGQVLFDFEVDGQVAHFVPLRGQEDAEVLYAQGCDLEAAHPEEARGLYRSALALNPLHAAAHVNLGRLLHEAGELAEAEQHYRRALEVRPNDPTASFNLAVAIEDQGRIEDAIAAYTEAIAAEDPVADNFFNLARLYERQGQKAAALRHLQNYRRRTLGPRA